MNAANKALLAENGWNIVCGDTLSDEEQREDAKIASTVIAKVEQMKKHGISVARYNAETGEAFLEYSDNTVCANS